MIKKLKIKLILLCVGLLTVLLSMIVMTMNIINYRSVVHDADDLLVIITESITNGDTAGAENAHTSEVTYETGFFYVVVGSEGETVVADVSRTPAVSAETATEYAAEAIERKWASGFKKDFRYLTVKEEGRTTVAFLDCGSKLSTFRAFMSTSILISILAIAIVAIIAILSSDKMISPIAESYNKQKRFITDAGHEIKTPLTIINANVDVLTMEIGHNECLEDIVRQTKRLTSLTNDLVYLAKMEENGALQKIEFPISEMVTEGVEQFAVLAESAGKKIKTAIQKDLSFTGDSKAINQLITILMDNAMKYSKEASTVSVSLKKHSRSITLTVSNVTQAPLSKVHLKKLFDRFYRTDKSRNSETGGHGIGLSVAKAITVAHGGKISASTSENNLFTITATLPTTSTV